jgi:hypothetical protein
VRRVDAGEAVEGRDEEAGVLHQDVPTKAADGERLRTGYRGEVVRLRLCEGASYPAKAHSERSEDLPGLAELSRVGRDERDVDHTDP